MLAKSKWRGLRDYYRQQLRRNMDQPAEMQYSSWAHFSEMAFLEGTMTPRAGKPIKDEPVPSPEITSAAEAMEQKWADPEDAWTDPNQTVANNAFSYTQYPESMTSDPDDDDLHFFKSLLPDLRNLPRPKKLFLRLKIQQLILNEIYGGRSEEGENRNNNGGR
ncbi:hypothetical protein GE061_005501 [Apolygus lucorum]|uniref:BESS domain-containing protein n=1 Tax=Apolygus lucorum TaxID=248454 RepID=A0A8S9WXU3_APOLU|nr:hypothetical protein GE061_005501 [Apolygus lucorum]